MLNAVGGMSVGREHLITLLQCHLGDAYELVTNVRRYQMRLRVYARKVGTMPWRSKIGAS